MKKWISVSHPQQKSNFGRLVGSHFDKEAPTCWWLNPDRAKWIRKIYPTSPCLFVVPARICQHLTICNGHIKGHNSILKTNFLAQRCSRNWQLLKLLVAYFYRTQILVTRRGAQSWGNWINFACREPTPLRSVLILSPHLISALPNGFFPWDIPMKTLGTSHFPRRCYRTGGVEVKF